MIRPPQLFTAPAVSFGAVFLQAAPALAAGRGEATPLDLAPARQSAESVAAGGGLVRTFVALVVVVVVIYGLYWAMRRIKSGREVGAGGRGALATVAGVPLGPGRAVHLVRAGREVVLVGSSQHGVALLRVYDEDQARAAGLLDDERHEDPLVARPSAGPLLGDALARLRKLTERR